MLISNFITRMLFKGTYSDHSLLYLLRFVIVLINEHNDDDDDDYYYYFYAPRWWYTPCM